MKISIVLKIHLLFLLSVLAFPAFAASLTLNVTTTDGYSSAGSLLYMEGLEPPNSVFEDTIPDGGTLIIENISCGNYLLKIMKPGYEMYRDTSFYICSDDTLNIILQEGRWLVWDFTVDPLTSTATWNEPEEGMILYENFENPIFPPLGWTNESMANQGWFRDTFLTGYLWDIPPHDGYFAGVYDDFLNPDRCCDYLITPPLNLSAYDDYILAFETFFDAKYGGSATVEYTTDGDSWEVLYELDVLLNVWREEIVDLSQWSGMASTDYFALRFHYNDNGHWADGWAVDNIKVAPASSDMFRNEDELIGYEIYLDGSHVGSTTDTLYKYSGLIYDQVYEAAYEALYSTGASAKEYYTFRSEYLVPAANLQVEAMGDSAFLSWDVPQDSTQLTGHLLGYNIYRDNFGEETDSLIFIDDPEQTQWYDANLAPKIYKYGLTAVYDLTPYGLPGQTDKSAMAGPVDCMISYGYDLPFTEDWESGSFSNQQWESNCDAWQINNDAGNDAPSAAFSLDDSLAAYECSLTSFPMKGTLYPGGEIFIVFDVKLEDIAAGSLEKLQLRVWRNGFWNTIWEKSNQGSFDWKPQQVSLSDYACGKDFKIAFVATGQDASNIDTWLIDNVHIYHICPAPYDLSAENAGEEVLLNWSSADTVSVFTGWLQWSSYFNFTSVGYDEPADFDVAARFEPADLQSMNGMYVKTIHFFPIEANCEYYVRVWSGSEAVKLLIDQKVHNVAVGQWNQVILSSPALINAAEELWIGYRCIAQEGFPAGVDEGPAKAGYGDMLYKDGDWFSIYQEVGLDYNWNIIGFVSAEAEEGKELVPLNKKPRKIGNSENKIMECSSSPGLSRHMPAKSANGKSTRTGFTGYNIYRKHNSSSWDRLNDAPVLTNEYIDPLPSGGDYCYYVEAIFEECVSATSDTVCVSSWLGTNETSAADLQVWPNPANDYIRISSSEAIERITFFNAQGQKVVDKSLNRELNFLLNSAGLKEGVYILKVKTKAGIIIKKVIIQN